MRWTNKKPTEPGYYWMRSKAGDRGVVVQVDGGEFWYVGSKHSSELDESDGEWSTCPIPAPCDDDCDCEECMWDGPPLTAEQLAAAEAYNAELLKNSTGVTCTINILEDGIPSLLESAAKLGKEQGEKYRQQINDSVMRVLTGEPVE